MVVVCVGTTGYNLRYLWMRQKRFQGSHLANDEQSAAFNQVFPMRSECREPHHSGRFAQLKSPARTRTSTVGHGRGMWGTSTDGTSATIRGASSLGSSSHTGVLQA
jgi:hypothetical protein